MNNKVNSITLTDTTRKNGLAIEGGMPVRKNPMPPWPSFSEEAIAAATEVLRSGKINYWTGGEGAQFEREFANSVGCKHAVALANGTVALELALCVLGIGPGDEVIVPSRTFIASASCAIMRGATPVVADVDANSQNITAESIRRVITPRTKAVVVVHLAGWPCDMDPIMELSREHGLKVIEDCAQAQGALYKGRPIGSIGNVAAFSFCQDKIMSTGGEGGMLTASDEQVWEQAWSFKDHGKSYAATHTPVPANGLFRWVHHSFGTNWRMTEMQSAMGRVLLRSVPEHVAIRRRNAQALTEAFRRIPALRLTLPPDEVAHAYYKYYAFLRPEMVNEGWTRDRIIGAICAEGVPCSAGSCSEIYLEKAFPESLRPAKRLPVARELGETSLMFLVHPTLAVSDMMDVARAVEKVFEVATGKRYSLAA